MIDIYWDSHQLLKPYWPAERDKYFFGQIWFWQLPDLFLWLIVTKVMSLQFAYWSPVLHCSASIDSCKSMACFHFHIPTPVFSQALKIWGRLSNDNEWNIFCTSIPVGYKVIVLLKIFLLPNCFWDWMVLSTGESLVIAEQTNLEDMLLLSLWSDYSFTKKLCFTKHCFHCLPTSKARAPISVEAALPCSFLDGWSLQRWQQWRHQSAELKQLALKTTGLLVPFRDRTWSLQKNGVGWCT